MKKLRRDCSSFFKVLVGDFSTKLMVPPSFMKNFNGELPKITTLKSNKDKSWGVLMEKSEKGYFFNKGWSKFVTDHHLQFGDCLVFWLITNSSFEVLIYDGDNACEKHPAFTPSTLLPNSLINKVDLEKSKIEPEIELADVDCIEPAKSLRFVKEITHHKHPAATPSTLLSDLLIKKVDHKKRKIEPKTEAADVDYIEPAKSLRFVKEITYKKMKYAMWMPVDFARETGLISKNMVTLKDISEGGHGEEWPMRLTTYGSRVKLVAGWSKFYTGKRLSLGDSFRGRCVERPHRGSSSLTEITPTKRKPLSGEGQIDPSQPDIFDTSNPWSYGTQVCSSLSVPIQISLVLVPTMIHEFVPSTIPLPKTITYNRTDKKS
ncbi:hypothetical protein ACFE04_023583 [Oxalis oulophora]